MFDKFKQFLGIQAATKLTSEPTPKVRPGLRAFPSYLKSARTSDSTLPRDDRRLINKDLLTYRNGASTRQVMRDFAASSPDLSNAVFAYIRLAITGKYRAVARNPDGTANPDATALLQQLVTRMNISTDYANGFSGVTSLQSVSESLAKEILLYGACSAELVLDKGRLPYRIQPISVTSIDFKQDKDILKPVQKLSGEEVDLDIPTFFYVALDQDLLDPYASSPMETALKAALFSEDFLADLHRVMKRAIHPRTMVKIDEQKFMDNLPAEALHDAAKLAEYQAAILSDLESKINGLSPESALVYFDTIEVGLDNNGNVSLSDEYKTIQDIANARLASGSKTMPAVLGHEVGSSNVASTSSMLFVKNATVVKQKLDEVYSRVFTLAIRLMGHDVYAEFSYFPIDLRPENELEAFAQTKQMRVLELLSLGLVSDEEAAIELTGHLPPPGYKPLSGTMFKSKAQESSIQAPSNDGSTLNQKLKSDQPENTSGRGQNTNRKADIEPTNITLNVDVDAKNEKRAEIIKMRRDEEGNLVLERNPAEASTEGLRLVG